jgi:hypothetical protein
MSTVIHTEQRQVTCILTSGYGLRNFESITHIGGAGWHLGKSEAIALIEAKRLAFYTNVGGHRAIVDVFEPYPGV